MIDPRSPCLIGVAQRTVHPGSGPAPEPLALWEEVVTAAAQDAKAGTAVLTATDSLQIVYCQTWPYDDPVGRLAGRLGIEPRHRLYSGIGGTTPQLLVQQAAERILRGESDVVVLTGAEALETLRQAKKAGERVAWSHRDPEKKPFPYEAPFHPAEVAHSVFQAWLTFALFDVARRGHLGVEPAAYRRALGDLLAPMTEVAASNPYAWFRRTHRAEDLISPRPDNRMVGYPYTKHMVSIMDVDMAAAVILTSHEAADRLGVPVDRRVYLRGWCYATDATYVAEHEPMWASPAMAASSRAALHGAGVGVDDVAHLDLYSCFASSVNFARDALGLAPDDARAVTVTGGLPFAGGPASNYMMHSIATMAGVLRADPGSYGLVSGVGMHMTKHVYGVYSSEPGASTPVPPDSPAIQAALDAGPRPAIVATSSGPGTVVAYSVVHAREGSPEWGLAVCDVAGGRCYARVEDPDLLSSLEADEWVGRTLHLAPTEAGVNLARA